MASAVANWNTKDVGNWLKKNGFKYYQTLFCKHHRIDGVALLQMTEKDLIVHLGIDVLGDVKRLLVALKKLQQQTDVEFELDRVDFTPTEEVSQNGSIGEVSPKSGKRRTRCVSVDSFSDDDMDYQDRFHSRKDSNDSNLSSGLPIIEEISKVSERWRTVASIIYAATVLLLTSFVMTVVHDRVPDMKKYPPLPDIFLDNVPLIPWAFDMCEITGMVLSVIWAITLLLHKHRLILVRRMCALGGTVFLLRCFTMFATSLSVPGIHLECAGKIYGDTWTRLKRAFTIFAGMGMSLNGVRSCGDYMFSGHTVTITLLNFFITEYTPKSLYFLHHFCWILNIFGIFFVLAAHEHYSIDVFIAFYISSRLFLYYHTLANMQALKRKGSGHTRIWFPLFSFFEEKVQGKVPNEYEWPLSWPEFLKPSYQLDDVDDNQTVTAETDKSSYDQETVNKQD